jgi:phage terminase small subunit
MKPITAALSPFEAMFVSEFIADFDSVAAFERTMLVLGREKPGDKAASLIARPHVRAGIDKMLEARAGATEGRIVDELAAIAFANITDFVEFAGQTATVRDSADIPKTASRAIKKISSTKFGIAIELHDKIGALDKLGAKFQRFAKKTELTGKDGAPLPSPVLVVFNADNLPAGQATPEQYARHVEARIAELQQADAEIEDAVEVDLTQIADARPEEPGT